MATSLYNTTSPYSYSKWLQFNTLIERERGEALYNDYIKQWYIFNKSNNTTSDTIKQDYINLLRELTFFFTEEEKNLFLKDIDFKNDIEIIYAIPFFVQKLKEIALTIAKKRESIKKTRNKYELIGSNQGIENIIYEYLLSSHTKQNNYTQINISTLGAIFPELSQVNDKLCIEIEELYDNNTQPTSVKEDVEYPRLFNNNLFNILNSFLQEESLKHTDISYIQDINKKYIGNNIFGLTATKFDINTPNSYTDLQFLPGNNWFYWPIGEVFTDISSSRELYKSISLNNSTLVNSGATAGIDYTDSDLLFVESGNKIEGAWLRGKKIAKSVQTMRATLFSNDTRTFIYPTPGYGLTTSFKWSGRVHDDEQLLSFNLLDKDIKQNVIDTYYSSGRSIENVTPIYINKTNLIQCSAYANFLSINSDSIVKRPEGPYNSQLQISGNGVYADPGLTQEAFLYKLTSTELPIKSSQDTYIVWPLTVHNNLADAISASTLINLNSSICNDITLGTIDVSSYIKGAVAGLSPSTSDVIYKIAGSENTPIEVAWLHGETIADLATLNADTIPIYSISASNCTEPITGPIQPNLNFVCQSNNYTSFVWCDIDTPADRVFNYKEHSSDCKYIQLSRDYIKNINDSWDTCTCKANTYSPLGHTGNAATDNKGTCDLLFADPQDLGSNFTYTQWRDTRNLKYNSSPQFAFYNKTDSQDGEIGWGRGEWKTGSGAPMILKTGRRYTYFRNTIKNTHSTTVAPNMVSFYAYKKIPGAAQSNYTVDLAIVIDISGSENYSIDKTKQLITNVIEKFNTNKGSQISIILFSDTAAAVSYLTTDKALLSNLIKNINIYNLNSKSNLYEGLTVAENILIRNYKQNESTAIASVCNNLSFTLDTSLTLSTTTNVPKSKNKKVIMFVSDGADSFNINKTIDKSFSLKQQDIKIVSIDIGPNSVTNNNLEKIASSADDYFNYEKSLIADDSNNVVNVLSNSILNNIIKTSITQPIWKKAALQGEKITPLYAPSDMIISPGDILLYKHAKEAVYSTFTTNAACVLISLPLYGWNYELSKFDGISSGARPYWGKTYRVIDEEKFTTRFARSYGGFVSFFEDYLPISHPEISDLILNNNDYIEYRNKGCKNLIWVEDIEYNDVLTKKEWLKLNTCNQNFNLKDIFNSINTDKIFEATEEVSDIALTTFKNFTPAYYCYVSKNKFLYKQPLLLADNKSTYSQILTSIALISDAPYLNLSNTHFAIVNSNTISDNLISNTKTGEYLLPTKIGVPYFLGRGSTNTLSLDKLNNLPSTVVYLDPAKYTSNRGLTYRDQNSPFITTRINNEWFKETYNTSYKSGLIVNTCSYQKFVPYHSSYETYRFNKYGISRQSDDIELWEGVGEWKDKDKYPTNYKDEPYLYNEKINSLLVTEDITTEWQTDVYGNNFGLLKPNTKLKYNRDNNTYGELWIRTPEDTVLPGSSALKDVYDNFIGISNSHYISLLNNKLIGINIIQDVLILRTLYGVSLIKYIYNSNKFSPVSYTNNYINLEDCIYIEPWWEEDSNIIYTGSLYIQNNIINLELYNYNVSYDRYELIFKEEIQSPINIMQYNNTASSSFNQKTKVLNISLIFNSKNICSVDIKLYADNPYIENVTIIGSFVPGPSQSPSSTATPTPTPTLTPTLTPTNIPDVPAPSASETQTPTPTPTLTLTTSETPTPTPTLTPTLTEIPSSVIFFFPNSGGIDQDKWWNIDNWWIDAGNTIQATSLPTNRNTVIINGTIPAYVDLDRSDWVQPINIDCTAAGVIFTSLTNQSVTCNIIGTATFINTARFGP